MAGYRKKSLGEQVKETATELVWVFVIYLVLYWLFMAVTWPFRAMFRTDKENLERKLERVREQIRARKELRKSCLADPNDPLNVYLEYKLHPEKGENPYAGWFEDLKAGRIADPALRWAPEVYNEEKVMSPEFVEYLARQIAVCRASGIGTKTALLRTVRRYYPEFTPKYSVMVSEVEAFRKGALTRELCGELVGAITAKGVPEAVARSFVDSGKTVEEIQKLIPVVKKFTGNGCSPEFTLFCLKHGIGPDHRFLEFGMSLLDSLGSEELALAGMSGGLDPEDVMAVQDAVEAELEVVDPAEKFDYFRTEMTERCLKAVRKQCLREISGGGAYELSS
jgi:hypothetical protein